MHVPEVPMFTQASNLTSFNFYKPWCEAHNASQKTHTQIHHPQPSYTSVPGYGDRIEDLCFWVIFLQQEIMNIKESEKGASLVC